MIIFKQTLEQKSKNNTIKSVNIHSKKLIKHTRQIAGK